ncbi:MAG: hypothetical protein ACMVO3_10895 [Thalassobaculum sp.]
MRLLIVGTLEGHISAAGQIALQRGAKVSHVDDIEAGLKILREGPGADLTMVDVREPVAKMLKQMKQERINCPVVACGVAVGPRCRRRRDPVPAPRNTCPCRPNPELIAAILAAVAEESRPASSSAIRSMAGVLKLADQIAPVRRQRADHRRIRHR